MVNPWITCHEMMEYDPLSGKPQFHGPCTDLWLFQPWDDTELCTEHFQLETCPWWRGKKLHNNSLLLWIIIKKENTDVYSDIFHLLVQGPNTQNVFYLLAQKKWKCDHLLCLCSTASWAFPSGEENTLKAVGRCNLGLLCNLKLLQI